MNTASRFALACLTLVLALLAPPAGRAQPSGATATPAEAVQPAVARLAGEWEGRYDCGSIAGNAFGLSVTEDGPSAISATFRFDVPGKPGQSGRFRLRGNAPGADGTFTLAPTEWVERADGFRPVGLTGQLSGNNLAISGKLLGCGTSSFEAHRKGAAAALRQAATDDPPAAPDSPGRFEGLWQGGISCAGRPGTGDNFPVSLVVSQQGASAAVLLTETVADRPSRLSRQAQGVFIGAPNAGGRLDVVLGLDQRMEPFFPRSMTLDTVAGTIQFAFYQPNCTGSVAKTSSTYPASLGASATGLPGTWSTPPEDSLRQDPRFGRSPAMLATTSLLEFRREGGNLYGQLRSFHPEGSPAEEQNRLVVDLRPIVVMADGRIGFVETRRRRAEGVFDPAAVPSASMFSKSLFLLVQPPSAPDGELQVAVSADRGFASQPNMLLRRRNASEVQAIAVGGGPPQALPAGLGGRIVAAQSLAQQCDVLASWGKPLIRRPDAMTAPVDRLQREAFPLFEDDVFVPVFGIPYAMTTPEQRRPVFFLLVRDCPQRMKMPETNHYDLSSPWSPSAEGSFSFASVTSGLIDRRDAKARIVASAARLAVLPETQDGLAELRQLDRGNSTLVDKLDEVERDGYATTLRENRLRIANGIMRARITAIGQLPSSEGSRATLHTLVADIGASELPPEEKEAAREAARIQARAIVQARIAAINEQAQTSPVSLAGLAQTNRAIREITVLAAGPDAGPGEPDGRGGAAPSVSRHKEILADAGVLKQFTEAVMLAAKRGTAEAVDAAAPAYLLPDEIAGSADGASYRQALAVARMQAEKERVAAVVGEDTGGAPAQAATAIPQSAGGEPSGPDMLSAFERLPNSLNAGQNDLAGRCARREFHNDPALAMMCLAQMGAGGPMLVHVTQFRKVACEKAQGRPGYVCDFSVNFNVSSGRNMGVLGDLMRSSQNCSGRFIRAPDGWVLEGKDCS